MNTNNTIQGSGSEFVFLHVQCWLDFVTQRSYRMGQFSQTQFQARFYRAERSVRRSGNFAVTQSLEESELDRFALKPRQRSYAFLEKAMQIVQDKRIIRFTTQISWLLYQSSPVTFPRTGIGLTPAQSVDGATTSDRRDPTERPAHLRRIVPGFCPDLEKNILQNIVSLGLFMNDTLDPCSESLAVASV